MHIDSHVHLYDLYKLSGILPVVPLDNYMCASSHDMDEFLWQEDFARKYKGRIALSFGIHPQKSTLENISFLELLVSARRIQAIGECGFDFFTPALKEAEASQREAWSAQLELATSSGLPLVIHCRKALPIIFEESKKLKKISAVVFHGWPGSPVEAESLLKRGINAFFSAGKGLLRGDRLLSETVHTLPPSRILTETDAPYMQGKGQSYSVLKDIEDVTQAAAVLMNADVPTASSLFYDNFRSVFGFFDGSVQVR